MTQSEMTQSVLTQSVLTQSVLTQSVLTLSGKARVAGVMGWPVAHSRSPRLHGLWLARHGIDGAYVPLAVSPDHFAQALGMLSHFGFAGVNITIPHKETALGVVDELDDMARRIGAVNTVIVREDGSLLGSNTDAYGFIENLRSGASGWRAEAGPALVIGAGGAARAVIVALLDAGAPTILVTNRTAARADALCAEFGPTLTAVPCAARATAVADVATLVNTTSLGMNGQPPLDLALDKLATTTLVTDVVYSPLETPLLSAAKARGNPTVDGLGMLLHQARPGFTAWFGVEPEVDDELRAHVLVDGL